MRHVIQRTAIAALAVVLSAPVAPAEDWSGPYVAGYGGYGVSGTNVGVAGAQAGYNWIIGNDWYVGGAIDASAQVSTPNTAYYTGMLRAGKEVAPGFLAFGSLGYGTTGTGVGTQYWSGGLGGHYMLGSNLFATGEVDFLTPVGGGTTRGFAKLGIGLNF